MRVLYLFALAGIALSSPFDVQKILPRGSPKKIGPSKSSESLQSVRSPKSPMRSPRTQESTPSLRSQASYDSLRWSSLDLTKLATQKSESPNAERPAVGSPQSKSPKELTRLSITRQTQQPIVKSPSSQGSFAVRPGSPAKAEGRTYGPGTIITNNQPGDPRRARLYQNHGRATTSGSAAEVTASSPWGSTVLVKGRKSVALHVANGPHTGTCIDCEFPGAKQRAMLGPGAGASLEYNNPNPEKGPIKVSVDQWGPGTSTGIAMNR